MGAVVEPYADDLVRVRDGREQAQGVRGFYVGLELRELRELVDSILLDQAPRTQRPLAEQRTGVEDAIHHLHSGADALLAAIADQSHLAGTLDD